MIYKWYEIWVDESTQIPYVLFLLPDDSGAMLVIDPKQSNQIINKLPDYNAAVLWLTEDEYTRVNGRMKIE
ncbi:MAG: hypothetical protein WBA13_10950 [Microcoleaceae cyanobacterium]